ncbi:MAG: hypothetical protein AB2556_23485, partial [Candidatus Thiodiazotropha sp.]
MARPLCVDLRFVVSVVAQLRFALRISGVGAGTYRRAQLAFVYRLHLCMLGLELGMRCPLLLFLLLLLRSNSEGR